MTGISLTNGVTTVAPVLRVGFSATNASRNILHDHLDNSIGVSLRPDLPRAGTLTLLFASAEDAETARSALAAAGVWTITDDYPAVSFSFVREGDLGTAQQDDRSLWTLDVGFREMP